MIGGDKQARRLFRNTRMEGSDPETPNQMDTSKEQPQPGPSTRVQPNSGSGTGTGAGTLALAEFKGEVLFNQSGQRLKFTREELTKENGFTRGFEAERIVAAAEFTSSKQKCVLLLVVEFKGQEKYEFVPYEVVKACAPRVLCAYYEQFIQLQ